jgi:hypothetical protein
VSNKAQLDQLVDEGIAAAKAGDKALARGKLEAAVKIDQYNEKAWFWLARMVETDEERRACLGNVIIINPQNKRAQELLDKLENRVIAKEQKAKRSPRLLMLAAGGLVVILGLIGLLLSGVLSGDDSAEVLPTAFLTSTITPTPDASQTAAVLLLLGPSDTPIPIATIPATWTATPGPTDTATQESFPTPPTGLPGKIIMQSGRVSGDDANQPIVLVNMNDLSTVTVSNQNVRGQNPVLAPGAARYAYAQYLSGTRSLTIMMQNVGFPDELNITSLYPSQILLSTPNYPTWSGNNLVFAAPEFGSGTHDLWLLELDDASAATPVPSFGSEQTATPTFTATATQTATPEGFQPTEGPSPTPVPPVSALTRLTNDAADNLWPAFDPTGTALVYVNVLNNITDLMVMNINTQAIFTLTTNGNQLVESAPDWGGDNEVIFSGSIGNAQTSDIYIMSASGESEPTVLIDFGPQDTRPRFSPDGRYIVFSSNARGNWDVFIYDRDTQEIYGLAINANAIDLANDWGE